MIAVKQPNQVTEIESPRVCFVLSDAECLGFPFNICALQSYNRKRLLLMSTIESRKVPRICLLFWRIDMLSMCSERIKRSVVA